MPSQNERYNAMELMVCVAARQLEDGKTAVIGTGMPLAAAMLAQKTVSPNLIIMFEAGSAAPQLSRLPISVADSHTQVNAILHSSMDEIMEACQRGMVDYTFRGPDRYVWQHQLHHDRHRLSTPEGAAPRQRWGQRPGLPLLEDAGDHPTR